MIIIIVEQLLLKCALFTAILCATSSQAQPVPGFDVSARWLGGSNTTSQSGFYGPVVDATTVLAPGARFRHCSAAMGSQSLVVFGGDGYGAGMYATNGLMNDLWKYDLSSGLWQWLSGNDSYDAVPKYGTAGQASALTAPGGIAGHSCSFGAGRNSLYVFGGNGKLTAASSGRSNDLWAYSFTTKWWTWLQGNSTNLRGVATGSGIFSPSNVPGPRQDSAMCIDGSEAALFVFGGDGYSITAALGGLNDLWKYEFSRSGWIWVSGSDGREQRGVYGALNTRNSSMLPGARIGHAIFAVNSGTSQELYLFGGRFRSSTAYLNDMWKVNLGDYIWTWLSGDSTTNKISTFDTSASPGARFRAHFSFMANASLILVFGGYGFGNSSASAGYLNDAWLYQATSRNWSIVGGSRSFGQGSVITASPADGPVFPGGRMTFGAAVNMSESAVILFGGDSVNGKLSDIWQIKVDSTITASVPVVISAATTQSSSTSSISAMTSMASFSSVVQQISSASFNTLTTVIALASSTQQSSTESVVTPTNFNVPIIAAEPPKAASSSTNMLNQPATSSASSTSNSFVSSMQVVSSSAAAAATSSRPSSSLEGLSTAATSTISSTAASTSKHADLTTTPVPSSFQAAQSTPGSIWPTVGSIAPISSSAIKSSSIVASSVVASSLLASSVVASSLSTLSEILAPTVDPVVDHVELSGQNSGGQSAEQLVTQRDQEGAVQEVVVVQNATLSVASQLAITASAFIGLLAALYAVRWARHSMVAARKNSTEATKQAVSQTSSLTDRPPSPSLPASARSGNTLSMMHSLSVATSSSPGTRPASALSSAAPTEYYDLVEVPVNYSEYATLPYEATEFSVPGFLLFQSGADFCWDELVAKGGGGDVYAGQALNARLAPPGTAIAVKIIGPSRDRMNPKLVVGVEQEISVMHYLGRHRNIAILLGWSDRPFAMLMKFYQYGSLAMLMKFYQYGSLENWIADRQATTKNHKLAFFMDTCLGLQFMHQKDVAHCDVKPGNILVDIDEQGSPFCALTDFGISRVFSNQAHLVKEFNVVSIRGASIMYAAPEVLTRHRLEGQAPPTNKEDAFRGDIYSLAMVCFELMTLQNGW